MRWKRQSTSSQCNRRPARLCGLVQCFVVSTPVCTMKTSYVVFYRCESALAARDAEEVHASPIANEVVQSYVGRCAVLSDAMCHGMCGDACSLEVPGKLNGSVCVVCNYTARKLTSIRSCAEPKCLDCLFPFAFLAFSFTRTCLCGKRTLFCARTPLAGAVWSDLRHPEAPEASGGCLELPEVTWYCLRQLQDSSGKKPRTLKPSSTSHGRTLGCVDVLRRH